MDYQTMVDRVAQYLDRTDLGDSSLVAATMSASKLGCWINDTRKDLALKYDFDYLYVEATISTSASTAIYALPTDYMGHLTILCDYEKLSRVGAREFDELYYVDDTEATTSNVLETTDSTTSGFPEYYVDRGMYIQLFPKPDSTHTVTMKYFAQPADLTDKTSSDYITKFHFEAIIFGAAYRGALYLDDIQKIQTFQQAYSGAIQEMIKREKEKQSRDTHVRWKSWKDYDLNAFKRMMRMENDV